MSAAERALVDLQTTWGEQKVDLVRFAVDHRELLVLKQSLGMSGKQVLIGQEAAVVAAAKAGTSVMQEFVAPRTCRLAMIADGADEPHDADVARFRATAVRRPPGWHVLPVLR